MKTQPPKIIYNLIEELKKHHDSNWLEHDPQCAPTGSRVICNPPVLNTDNDWLVFVPDSLQEKAMEFMENQGATHSLTQETYPDGVCYRYGDINPILIWEFEIYYCWVAATYWASKLNLQDKADRTAFFQSLVDYTFPLKALEL
jgi:hypothetical protein